MLHDHQALIDAELPHLRLSCGMCNNFYATSIRPTPPPAHTLHYYTDGSSVQGKWNLIGAAGLLCLTSNHAYYAGHYVEAPGKQTNNLMEMGALLLAAR